MMVFLLLQSQVSTFAYQMQAPIVNSSCTGGTILEHSVTFLVLHEHNRYRFHSHLGQRIEETVSQDFSIVVGKSRLTFGGGKYYSSFRHAVWSESIILN
jgi:hypothetical protein